MSDIKNERKIATIIGDKVQSRNSNLRGEKQSKKSDRMSIFVAVVPAVFYIFVLMLSQPFQAGSQDLDTAAVLLIFSPIFLFQALIASAMILGSYILLISQNKVGYRMMFLVVFTTSFYFAYKFAARSLGLDAASTDRNVLTNSMGVCFGLLFLWLLANAAIFFGRDRLAPAPNSELQIKHDDEQLLSINPLSSEDRGDRK